ncbi:phosphoribosylamine--glycine ligase [Roseivirga ehrenbergii]|uniref:Phosphoribosylamine--glycine ligase n=1 Tax=Roseivirga ehrenbergii (strain DSM 102268 / JCM 13514 / KCTC 12282 / NCIMB 14502 / KMM 6017) TaxID=279360 RepID=A0A150WXG8_ROSEK|nr:phosphoribosylamine--glycine ligase [Roseivirga ehrenbergii]KYG71169.1 phosphoribosylamine--glycine ligase [Roseivirga ehrenbergii]TCK99034.1 phosphoribosylamine--glycine ligase [Roseivirga ehrenbergii]
MNILVLGSGGREHAFAWKISQSPRCNKLFVAPGNAGTASIAENVNIKVTDFKTIGEFVIENQIDLVVVGPEDPLVNGIRDYFEKDSQLKNVLLVGPGAAGAQLEGSKDFSKDFMNRHGVPTAKSKTFTIDTLEEGLNYVSSHPTPIVLKADGLAAGKGVIISETAEHARETLKEMLVDAKFGEASSRVVVEQFLHGIELSVFVLSDGSNYKILPEAKDYKRIGEKDTGLNTGGMGAISPVPFATKEFLTKVEERVIKPTINGLKQEGIDYKGFLFIGLMNMEGEPYVIEYNVRMGDPETQSVLSRIDSDLLEILEGSANGTLHKKSFSVSPQTATTVVMVAGGYPEAYEKGKEISGIEMVNEATVFHAGTQLNASNQVLTNGGRVLAVTGMGASVEKALENAYNGVNKISWQDEYHRTDIGQDILKLLK